MCTLRRPWILAWVCLFLTTWVTGSMHGAEAVGSPAIESLLQYFRALQPIPMEKVWREPPSVPPQERPRLALMTGRLIADGFLVVASERPTKVAPVGRSLLQMGSALGFRAKIMRRCREVIDQAEKERWTQARLALARLQPEAENALRELRDADLVDLLALGGWLRGLEIASTTAAADYTPERSQQLWRPELAEYFLSRLASLRPELRSTHLMRTLEKALSRIKNIAGDGKPLSEGEMRKLRDVAGAACDAMSVSIP